MNYENALIAIYLPSNIILKLEVEILQYIGNGRNSLESKIKFYSSNWLIFWHAQSGLVG